LAKQKKMLHNRAIVQKYLNCNSMMRTSLTKQWQSIAKVIT